MQAVRGNTIREHILTKYILKLVMVHERVKPVFGTKCCKQNSKDDEEEEEADESRHAKQHEVVPAAPCTWLNSIQLGWGTWLFF